MRECPAPETGPFAGFVAAYRADVPQHVRLTAAAASISKGGPADTWVASLAADPAAHPAWCRGSLGFAYDDEGQSKAPVATSFALVFKDEASAHAAYLDAAPNLFAGGSSGAGAGFGADSRIRDEGTILWVVWQRGAKIDYLLCQDVDTCMAAARSMDARLA
jgi:hypothetical protein